nr:tripartite tricarboxylate transporter substrate binding protein [Pseudomonas sp.]
MDRRSFCLTVSAALVAGPLQAFASQAYPSRSVRIISPYAAGGGPDVQLRQAGPVLGEALGQTIVIENKVGAAGVLAAQYVSQQELDGYTLLMASNT